MEVSSNANPRPRSNDNWDEIRNDDEGMEREVVDRRQCCGEW